MGLNICTVQDDRHGEALLRSWERAKYTSQGQEGWGWRQKREGQPGLSYIQRLSIGHGVPAGGKEVREGKLGKLSMKPSAPWGVDLPGPKCQLAAER